MTPASKPGAGAEDHWEGSPSWGNVHGAEWYELASIQTIPGTETLEYTTMTLTRESDYQLEVHGDEFLDSLGHPFTVKGHNDWITDRTEIVNRYITEMDVKYYLYRVSGSTPDQIRKTWNVYTYRFLQWMFQRQETRTA